MRGKARWAQIKQLKSGYKPKVYEKNDAEGRPIPITQKAEATADYLERKQWGDRESEEKEEHEEHRIQIVSRTKNTYNTERITVEEIKKHTEGQIGTISGSGQYPDGTVQMDGRR